jgi:quercetin dioxygenase-like cupin family protein
MTKTWPLAVATALLATAWCSPTSAQMAPDREGFLLAGPEKMVPPEGGRTINILGNPSEPGFYVLRIIWEPGQGSQPHFHDQARLITVLEGTWYVSTGAASDVYDPDNMTPVTAGAFIYEPPNGHHYDMAKDERVVVQITGMGPVSTTSIPQTAR